MWCDGMKKIFGTDDILSREEPMGLSGWAVVQHKDDGFREWDPKRFVVIPLGLSKGDAIDSLERGGASDDAQSASPNLLDFFLANPELIPVECRGKKVFFLATQYRDKDHGDSDAICARYLYQKQDEWDWDHEWVPEALCDPDNFAAVIRA